MYTYVISAFKTGAFAPYFEVLNAFYEAVIYRIYNVEIEYCNFQNSIVLILIK